jgi:predicted permease
MGARGNADFKTAVRRVLKLPVIHAVWLGLLLNLCGFEMPQIMGKYWNYATGAWVFIGMMLIGVALSKQAKLVPDWRLMAWMFAPKFILWPLAGFGIIAADAAFFHALDADIYKMIAIFTSVPLAGNVVAFAANLDLHPERAATAVLASTLLAIVTVPGALALATLIFG